jgi:hypothetical protein
VAITETVVAVAVVVVAAAVVAAAIAGNAPTAKPMNRHPRSGPGRV